ncbi:hypothetical protein CN998_33135, partial [Bacillus cereus]
DGMKACSSHKAFPVVVERYRGNAKSGKGNVRQFSSLSLVLDKILKGYAIHCQLRHNGVAEIL